MRITLDEAIQRLQTGEVVAVPTETVYGLAASITQPKAIEEIFVRKGRPRQNPLIVHVANREHIAPYVKKWPPSANALLQAFWPGPLTLVVPIREETIPSQIRAGLPTAAFRMPAHSTALVLLEKTGPLVMPSANLSGTPSATRPEHVEHDFGHAFPVLVGDICQKGVESTIVFYDQKEWVILRQGVYTAEEFEPILGYQPKLAKNEERPIAPGQRFRHYAPKAKLILAEKRPEEDSIEAVMGFSNRQYPNDVPLFSLGPESDVNRIAQSLYGTLRKLDEHDVSRVWVDMRFPTTGLWMTIRERLQRAA